MLRIIANQRQSDKLFHLLASVGEFERPSKPNGDKKKNGKWQMMQRQVGTRHTHFFFYIIQIQRRMFLRHLLRKQHFRKRKSISVSFQILWCILGMGGASRWAWLEISYDYIRLAKILFNQTPPNYRSMTIEPHPSIRFWIWSFVKSDS